MSREEDEIEADRAEAHRLMVEKFRRTKFGEPDPSDDDWFDASVEANEGDTRKLLDALRSRLPVTPWARSLLVDLINRHNLIAKDKRNIPSWEKPEAMLEVAAQFAKVRKARLRKAVRATEAAKLPGYRHEAKRLRDQMDGVYIEAATEFPRYSAKTIENHQKGHHAKRNRKSRSRNVFKSSRT